MATFKKILIVSPFKPTLEQLNSLRKKYGSKTDITPTNIIHWNLQSFLNFAIFQDILAFIRSEDIPEGLLDPVKNSKSVIIYDNGTWKKL